MVGSKNCHREHDIAWHEEKNSTYINSFDRFKWLHTQMYVKVIGKEYVKEIKRSSYSKNIYLIAKYHSVIYEIA